MSTLGRLILSLLLAFVVGPLYSQDRNAFPFVDLGRAQNIIDTLTKENETLKADSDRLQQQIDQLKAQILATKKGADDLSPLLDEARARSHDLAVITDGIVDTTMRTKASAAATKSSDLVKRLAQRMGALGLQTQDWTKQVQTLTDQVSVDQAKVIRNTEDIIVLQATVAKTKAQQARLSDVIDQIDALANRVDAALK